MKKKNIKRRERLKGVESKNTLGPNGINNNASDVTCYW